MRALALGEVDTTDFYLAEKFQMLPRQIRELPNIDIEELAAFFTYKEWRQQHANDVSEMRMKRG